MKDFTSKDIKVGTKVYFRETYIDDYIPFEGIVTEVLSYDHEVGIPHYMVSGYRNPVSLCMINRIENMKITDRLRKFPNYEVIPYSADLCCVEGDMKFMVDKPSLVGWCETNIGHMMVLECPKCFSRYRYHSSDHWDDTLEEFNDSLIDKLLDDYGCESPVHFLNGKELCEQLGLNDL